MRFLLSHRPKQFPVQFIPSPASRHLPTPSLTLGLLQTSYLQPSFLLALNPGQMAFLPCSDPIPPESCSLQGASPGALEGSFPPPWIGLERGKLGKTLI